MPRAIMFFLLLPLAATAGSPETPPLKKNGEFLPPAHFLHPEDEPRAKVFLLGTWHFAYPGQDAHKTADDKRVDILSHRRQTELEKVLDYLQRFRPNAVALECKPDSNIPSRYRRFLEGKLEEKRDERYQIGFRMAKRMDLERVHCVGADSFFNDHRKQLVEMGALPEGYDFRSDDPVSRRYDEWYEYRDRIQKQANLMESLAYMNRDDVLDAGFGSYLVGDFRLGGHGGADALALYWYNRNLRLFRNIQQITNDANDRILVVYGAGHMQILKELFESSPEYERVPFDKLHE